MNRDAIIRVRAAENLAVLGQRRQQAAVGNIGIHIDIQEMVRERITDRDG